MPLRDHINRTLKFEKAPSPWPRMILCALSVGLPLIMGAIRGELRGAIFGALFGYILIINDHFGTYKKRILHLLTCFVFIVSSFLIGSQLIGHDYIVTAILFAASFILALAKDKGLELERMILLSILQFLMASQSPELKGHFSVPLFYTTLSFFNYIVCLSFVYLILKHTPNFSVSKRDIFRSIIRPKTSLNFAFTYAITVCLGFIFAKWFHIDHDYWVPGTILIVMMPDHYQSIYRGAQRLLGTIIGVVVASLLIKFGNNPIFLILFSMIFAFFTPYGQTKNFWLGNAFVAGLILFLLEIASNIPRTGEFDLAILRVKDIGLGCFMGVFATLLTHPEIITKKIHNPRQE